MKSPAQRRVVTRPCFQRGALTLLMSFGVSSAVCWNSASLKGTVMHIHATLCLSHWGLHNHSPPGPMSPPLGCLLASSTSAWGASLATISPQHTAYFAKTPGPSPIQGHLLLTHGQVERPGARLYSTHSNWDWTRTFLTPPDFCQ